MTFLPQNHHDHPEAVTNNNEAPKEQEKEPILCPHCRRTASNGITCKGICVADSDY
ncbi:MAG: hypothetical protein AAGF26_09350 [Cyanobacteria bacterium P01_G01_bin.49]